MGVVCGRLLRADDGKQQYEYTYAPCGKKASVRSAADGTLENYAYDGLGRLLSITQTEQSSSRILFKIEYVLGADGNRLGIVETDADGAITTKRYTYDALGRLVADQSGSGAAPATWAQNNTYTYDADSNRLTHGSLSTGQTFSYSYVAGSQRLAAIRVNGLLHQDFVWSANGEQTQVRSYGQDGIAVTETQSQTWNPDGSMAAVAIDYADASKPDVTVRYGYDHTGTLISRKVTRDSGSSAMPPVVVDWERYAVDHRNLTGYSQVAAVFKVSGDNGQTNKLARLHFLTDQVAAQTDFTGMDASGAATAITRNLHTDALGSIRTVNTRAQGSSVSSGGTGGSGAGDLSVTPLNYTAFGTPTEPSTSLRPTEYAFTGQMRDSVTGLQYHRARWFASSSGLWTAADPQFDFVHNSGSAYNYPPMPAAVHDPTGMQGTLGETAMSVAITALNAAMAIGSYSLPFYLSLTYGNSLREMNASAYPSALLIGCEAGFVVPGRYLQAGIAGGFAADWVYRFGSKDPRSYLSPVVGLAGFVNRPGAFYALKLGLVWGLKDYDQYLKNSFSVTYGLRSLVAQGLLWIAIFNFYKGWDYESAMKATLTYLSLIALPLLLASRVSYRDPASQSNKSNFQEVAVTLFSSTGYASGDGIFGIQLCMGYGYFYSYSSGWSYAHYSEDVMTDALSLYEKYDHWYSDLRRRMGDVDWSSFVQTSTGAVWQGWKI